jgi:hypothetical protein
MSQPRLEPSTTVFSLDQPVQLPLQVDISQTVDKRLQPVQFKEQTPGVKTLA